MNDLVNEKVMFYYSLLYPDPSKMSSEDMWYAEDSKDILKEHLKEMNLRTKRLSVLRPDLSKEERVRLAFNEVLTKHYCSILGREDDFISSHLDEINRRYIDARELVTVQSSYFDPLYTLVSVMTDIKLENRQKSIQ